MFAARTEARLAAEEQAERQQIERLRQNRATAAELLAEFALSSSDTIARRLAYRAARKRFGWSTVEIALAFGRNQSSIVRALKR
jgi:hypothetical protein